MSAVKEFGIRNLELAKSEIRSTQFETTN